MMIEDNGGPPTALLHQILLVDGYDLPETIPYEIEDNAAALKAAYPDADYRLWDGHALRAVLKENFKSEVLWAFDTLEPYAFKCDLARFCLLYRYGGLYVDLGVRFLNPLRPPWGAGIASFRDYDLLSPSWVALSSSIIWAVPRREEFLIAINYIVENCRNRFYGKNPLYPTGPVLFGRALIAAMAKKGQASQADDQWIGLCHPITPETPNKNVTFVAPDHTVIAIRTKRIQGDISHMGVVGANNYHRLWHNQNAYGEKNLREKEWTFDDPRIHITKRAARTNAGIVTIGQDEGCLTYGPYIELTPGRYRVSVHLDGEITLPKMQVDVAHSGGEQIASVDFEPGPRSSPTELELIFTTNKNVSGFEFRTYVGGAMQGSISKFRLERLEDEGAESEKRDTAGALLTRGPQGLVSGSSGPVPFLVALKSG